MDYNISEERDCNEFPPVETADDVILKTEEEVINNSEIEALKKEENKPKNTRGRKPKSEEKGEESVTHKYKAKVIQSTKNGYTGVSIYEFGIKIATSKSYNVGDTIEIQFEGTIGKSDFRVAGAM